MEETTEQQNPTKTAAEHNAEQTGIMKWLPLLVISLALTIIILDTTILNVTLRTIIVDLNTNIQSIQWVITGYSLIIAAFTITGGRMGDLFGRKKMFVLGAIILARVSCCQQRSPCSAQTTKAATSRLRSASGAASSQVLQLLAHSLAVGSRRTTRGAGHSASTSWLL
jgi:MFS family permease